VRRNKLDNRHCSAPRGLIARSPEMRCTVPVPIPSDLATFKIVLGWQIRQTYWIAAPSAPLGTRKTQRKQEGGKGGGIANGGRFRRRRLPKFLNDNNTPLAVTNGGMDRTGRR